MLKFIAIILFILLAQIGQTQTIDNSWFYEIGVDTKVITNFGPPTSDPGSPGLDQEWDFSDAEPRFPMEDTINYIAIEDSRYGNFFPDADICKTEYNFFFDSEYFYQKDDESLTFIGASIGWDTFIINNNLLFMQDGFSYGDTLWRSSDKNEYYLFDATGTVTTPSGTYENCIRFQHELFTTGLNEFVWYQENLMKEVVKVFPVEFDTLLGRDYGYVKYLQTYDDNRVSITHEHSGLGITATKLSSNLVLRNDDKPMDVQVTLYDMNGRALLAKHAKLEEGLTLLALPESLPSQYAVLFIQKKGSPAFYTQKLFLE